MTDFLEYRNKLCDKYHLLWIYKIFIHGHFYIVSSCFGIDNEIKE